MAAYDGRKAKIVTRTDPKDEIIRHAIQLDSEQRHASIDVLRPDGTLLTRINLFAFESGGGSVDVIAQIEDTLRVLAFYQGDSAISYAAPMDVQIAIKA